MTMHRLLPASVVALCFLVLAAPARGEVRDQGTVDEAEDALDGQLWA